MYFCTRNCGAKWKMSQPNLIKRMISGKDLVAAGLNISRGIMQNPTERKRRSESLKNLLRRGLVKRVAPKCGIGQQMSPCEIIVAAMFPEAAFNFHIKTGLSSKLGHPGNYYLDFACPKIKLDVEIDGYNHNSDRQKKKDAARTEFLNGLGWKVLRFSNTRVKRDSDSVKAAITYAVSRLKQRKTK